MCECVCDGGEVKLEKCCLTPMFHRHTLFIFFHKRCLENWVSARVELNVPVELINEPVQAKIKPFAELYPLFLKSKITHLAYI